MVFRLTHVALLLAPSPWRPWAFRVLACGSIWMKGRSPLRYSLPGRLPPATLMPLCFATVALQIRSSILDSPIGGPLQDAGDWWDDMVKPLTESSHSKLLPNWPLPIVPPDTPLPMTLVVGLEETLVSSTWSRKYGWRHAKRPGVDEFLEQLSKSFEIVIFTYTQHAFAEPVCYNVDKKGYVLHRLYKDATKYVDGEHVKDLTNLNRDLRRVVVVDALVDGYKFQVQCEQPITTSSGHPSAHRTAAVRALCTGRAVRSTERAVLCHVATALTLPCPPRIMFC